MTIGVQADLDAAAAYFADWNGLAEWSKPYIAAAFAKGLVTGTVRNGKYYINGASPITRAEVAVLLQNAYRLAADASNLKSFGDTIPSWAVDSVSALASRRVINGYPDSTFMAGAHATRAEIVVMLMALIDA
ncbi:S-layer homology domain-containing protein [Cohnella rhizosphaerae]|uniref:S-layer homology domain-containing protein n=1 Tax=Cohnella rhizosphaerae TaxID=1457232 RepID=A0A9X4L098_9BACL|nr:S-layer homology domain-containing protein [Cohnella rhizosphaerae]